MATTRSDRVGRTRERLAAMLAALGYDVDAADLNSQIPVYATPQWDCCSWYATAYSRELRERFSLRERDPAASVHLFSYDTMTMCVRYGFDLLPDGNQIEVSANRPSTGRTDLTRED